MNVEFAQPLDYVEPPQSRPGYIDQEELEKRTKLVETENYYVPIEGKAGVPNIEYNPDRLTFCRVYRKPNLVEIVNMNRSKQNDANNEPKKAPLKGWSL